MKGWVGLGWLVTYRNKVLPPGVEPGHVTHLSTNRARRRVTLLIRPTPLPLRHAANSTTAVRSACQQYDVASNRAATQSETNKANYPAERSFTNPTKTNIVPDRMDPASFIPHQQQIAGLRNRWISRASSNARFACVSRINSPLGDRQVTTRQISHVWQRGA